MEHYRHHSNRRGRRPPHKRHFERAAGRKKELGVGAPIPRDRGRREGSPPPQQQQLHMEVVGQREVGEGGGSETLPRETLIPLFLCIPPVQTDARGRAVREALVSSPSGANS